MSEDVEKQIDRFVLAANIVGFDRIRQAARDLLAGKFKEEPLVIARPPFECSGLSVYHARNRDCFYVTAEGAGFSCTGPDAKTERAAILAWNAVFERKDER